MASPHLSDASGRPEDGDVGAAERAPEPGLVARGGPGGPRAQAAESAGTNPRATPLERLLARGDASPESLPADSAFARPASEESVARARAALGAHGIRTVWAPDREAARRAVLDLLPVGAEVLDTASRTLEGLSLTSDALAALGYKAIRPEMVRLTTAGRRADARKLGSAPDYVLGSVHAVTETGQLVVASASGSQLPAYAYGAEHAIWVAGTNKIVPDLDAAFRRIERYTYPLEDARARGAYGVPSAVAKLLVINRELAPAGTPSRATLILVPEALGF
jgi:hypothetical protein